ncbi:MAG: cadmium-translocating P-type ATPase [Proteobacteria bacterium]|nr:cadmium-translocating P-type ATPase [Pseudomonadota bacterium]
MAIASVDAIGCPSGLAPPDEAAEARDLRAFVRRDRSGADRLELMVEGASCAGCIKKIESAMLALPGVRDARLNLSTRRLRVDWTPGALDAQTIADTLTRLGYGARSFDPEMAQRSVDAHGRFLLRRLAVAGFGAMNTMMFSAPIWFGDDMGQSTRTLLHWLSALVAIPCALYAAQPFFGSAFKAMRAGRANMDVPISLAVVLTLSMSVAETLQNGAHAYFDGITMLLFFLLIGRYLDHSLRERARTAARELLALQAVTASRIGKDGVVETVSAREVAVGDRLLLAAGDRAPCDGVIATGVSDLDCSMLSGESLPVAARAGDPILAGAVNLTKPVEMIAQARVENSAVAELARLIEAGEQGRGRFVRLADRAASLYVPVVHSLAALTFVGWFLGPALLRMLGFEVLDVGLRAALQNAVAVLIITCPCALGLAVPVVQVVATGRLFKRGVLVRSGDALERLATADTIVFDKTGTLTLGRPRLFSQPPGEVLQAAASLARASRHPLSRALVEAAGPGAACASAVETPGEGVAGIVDGARARLGKRSFVAPRAPDSSDGAPELWFAIGDASAVRFLFTDALRADAAATIAALKARGYLVEMLSGDREAAVASAAAAAGIATWRAGVSPAAKTAYLQELRAAGRKPLMVGDGLNDAAALAAAHASASPGAAIEASQAAADIILQSDRLMVLVEALSVAKAARARSLENLGFSAIYNLVAAPLAALGFLTPLIAACAMSGSSLIVTLNALRMQTEKAQP